MKNVNGKFKSFLLWLGKYGKWVAVVICLAIFAVLAEDVLEKEPVAIDSLSNIVITFRNTDLTNFVKFFTDFGIVTLPHILAIIVVPYLLLKKGRRSKLAAVLVVVNLLFADVFNLAIKGIFHRSRPSNALMSIGGFSFPSGHSMIAMIFYGYLIYLAFTMIKNKYAKWAIIGALAIVILAIGLSRIYLGVHYVSDVVASFALSIVYLILLTTVVDYLAKRWNRRRSNANSKASCHEA